MEFWDILGRFGGLPATEQRTTDNNEKKTANTNCFQRIWDVRVLNTLQKPMFWTNFILKNA